MPKVDLRTHHSTYVEKLFTHRFLYDISRCLAVRPTPLLLTTLRSEIDDSGIDLVLKLSAVTCFVQLKTRVKKRDRRVFASECSLIVPFLGST